MSGSPNSEELLSHPLPGEEPELSAVDSEHAHSRDFINQGSRFVVLDNVSKVASPLLVLLCARLYAGGEWGFFKYYESILLLLIRLAVAGMDRGVVWIYARRGADESFIRVFSRAVNFVMLFAALLSVAAALQWVGWLPSFGKFAHGVAGASILSILCYLLAVPLQAATTLFLQALINKRELVSLAVIRNIAVPVATFGPAALMALTPLKAYGLSLAYLFGSLLGLLLSAVFFFRAYPVARHHWGASAWVPRDMLRFSLPLASTDFAMSFAYRMDILLLGRFIGLQAVEIYSVVVMIANTLRSVRQSFDGILLSVFSRASHGKLSKLQSRNFNYASWLVLSIQLPCIPLVLLFGSEILRMIGPTYAPGGTVLVVAIMFIFVNTLSAFYSLLVMAQGRTWVFFISQVGYISASIVFNLWLVPRYGMNGAAVALGLAGLVNGIVSLGGILAFNRSIVLNREFMRPLFMSALWFIPAVAVQLFWPLPLPARIAVFAVGLGGFGWRGFRDWKHFNVHAS